MTAQKPDKLWITGIALLLLALFAAVLLIVAGTHIFKARMQPQHPSADSAEQPHGPPDKPCLYTAWWYDNGIRQPIRPFDWRWDLLHGAPAYAVVNVTASTPQDLDAELIRILKTRPFRSLLGRSPIPARVKIR